MSPEVTPNFKLTYVCACGCGKEGPARRKKWVDGFHVRSCECRRCKAGGYGKAERRRVRRFSRAAGLTPAPASGNGIGFDAGGVVLVEETAAEDVVRGLRNWWQNVGTQRKVRDVMRQRIKPGAFVASWDGKPQLVVMTPEHFIELCQATWEPGDAP